MTHVEFQRSAISPSECIGNAWTLVTNKIWLYIGISLLSLIIVSCIPLVSLFLMGPIFGGFYYVVLRDMRGEPVEFGMMFKGFEKFVPLMVVGLIQAIPGVIMQVVRFTVDISQLGIGDSAGTPGIGDSFPTMPPNISAILAGLSTVLIIVILVFAVFAAVWGLLLHFAIPIALEHDVSPIDALKLSISAVTANLGGLILLFILEFFVGLLGMLALCLGYFVAIPVIYAANVFAYRQVFPLIENNFNFTPPPPSAYGSNFGSGM